MTFSLVTIMVLILIRMQDFWEIIGMQMPNDYDLGVASLIIFIVWALVSTYEWAESYDMKHRGDRDK